MSTEAPKKKPTCTECGKPDSATVYSGGDERLCDDCWRAPPKEITVYVGGAHGAKGWWVNGTGGGERTKFVRADLALRDFSTADLEIELSRREEAAKPKPIMCVICGYPDVAHGRNIYACGKYTSPSNALTGKEICWAYALFKRIPAKEREAWAKRFWESSPSGELFHVFAARDEMIAAGFLKGS